MNLPKVTIQIVTYNSMRYLRSCLESIFESDYTDFQVLIIDNNSGDGTVDFVRKNYPMVTVFQNKNNVGFARANNQGIRLLHSPYVLFCNPDIVLTKDWLSKTMENVESDRYNGVASFGGKLLKFKMDDGEVTQDSFTEIIDSCGLQINNCRRVVEIGAGRNSTDFENESGVFGHSGALVLYRREALENMAVPVGGSTPEYFDEDFFSYKEDVDLAWRAKLLGWNSVFLPESVAYHVRSVSGSEKDSVRDIVTHRKGQSPLNKYYSYRNHLLLLLKNEHRQNFIRDFFHIVFFEMKKAIYVLFFETKNISALLEVVKMSRKMRKKRKIILKKSKSNHAQIYNWIK
jgi:GT2 family glycosyltransferase